MMYVCPMHPEVRQDHPGICTKCGSMKLIPEADVKKDKSFFSTYRALFVIIGLILLTSVLITIAQNDGWQNGMLRFMGGFFVVFAGLKLIDIPGFAKGYATYDLLAQKAYGYGYLYPFLELILGLLYLTRTELVFANLATVILMLFSGMGVAIKLMKHEKFECACLGTMIKVPLTKVTLIEDFGMAAMAALMLVI